MSGFLPILKLVLLHWRRAALGVLLSSLAVLANVGLLGLSSWFIASMALAGSIGAAMNYSLPAAGVRALAIGRAVLRYFERLVNHDTSLRLLSTLRSWFFIRLEPLAPARLDAYRSGDLLARIGADVDSLDDFYVRALAPSIAALLSVSCILPFLASFDWRIAAIDAAALAFAGILAPLALRSLARKAGRESVELASELRARAVEDVRGMAELLALGAAEYRAGIALETESALRLRRARLESLQGLGDAVLVAASSLACWLSVLLLVAGPGAITGPQVAMLAVLVLASFESILALPGVIQKSGELRAASHRLFGLVEQRPAVAEPASAAQPRAAITALSPAPTIGVTIDELHFRYTADSPWVLRGFSMRAGPGARIGIVGPTGSGKSSIVNVLMRFWDYDRGSISIELAGDGSGDALRDLRSISLEEARSFFAVLPQSPHLFHSSIRDNLVLADARSTASEGAMREAIETVQLSAFLAALPSGLDSVVGETGRRLSAGEARRLAAARALLKDAPVYILDEPTEGLDDDCAEAFLDAIEARLSGRILIVISHRPRDLRIVDEVVRIGSP